MSGLTLSPLFSDHAVLQRDKPVPIWGRARPGEKISVQFGKQKRSVDADRQGCWQIDLAPLRAGGLGDLSVSTQAESLVCRDLLVGDVWLCSGQSNMEWPVIEARHAAREMAAAHFPRIRLFQVPRRTEGLLLDDGVAHWKKCTTESVAYFSAVAYFFGRHLHRELEVPIGLIQTAWGGTEIETWMAADMLERHSKSRSRLKLYRASLRKAAALRKAHEKEMRHWQKERHREDVRNESLIKGWALPEIDVRNWTEIRLPKLLDQVGVRKNGAFWFRREIEIPADWQGRDLQIELGAVDDYDTTYFSGEKVGATGPETAFACCSPRSYSVPGKLVHAGRATIAVRVFDHFGSGGFVGSVAQMRLILKPLSREAPSLPLGGCWHYKQERALPLIASGPPAGPLLPENPNAPTALFQGMFAPLAPFALRGFTWYQGESNAARAGEYAALLKTMIRGWRKLWHDPALPFLVVQLANFMPATAEPQDSNWAELREAQAEALALPMTGLAVTIDIGEANDIHPRNKQEVGRRLALAAMKIAYRKKIIHSGPQLRSHRIEKDKIILSFDHIGGGLIAKKKKPTGFAIAGIDRKFRWAQASISGKKMIVSHPSISQPVAVRYAWSTNPVCNLSNSAGLPASPFRTDRWPASSNLP